MRAAVKLRYRLLPYLYACFLTATETGAPVQRPLVFDYQYDGSVRDIDDEFLLGPDLLVAPVTGPGATARQVYLPAGDWYDWHSGELVGGTRFVVAETPMDRIPIYARGGAVIPMWAEAPATTAGYHPKVVELHVFVPAADGSHTSMLAEDDGLTNAALDGACYRTTFTLARSGDQVTVQAKVTGDGYPEFAREQFTLVVHGAQPATATLDGNEISGSDGRFLLPNAGTGFTLELAIGDAAENCCQWATARRVAAVSPTGRQFSADGAQPSAAGRVQQLQQVVRGKLDLLVPPLRGAVDARDQAGPVHPAEVAVDERVAGLGLVVGADCQAEVPGRVVGPGMPLQEGVLRVGGRLHFAPVAVEDVLPGLDQLAALRDASLFTVYFAISVVPPRLLCVWLVQVRASQGRRWRISGHIATEENAARCVPGGAKRNET